MVSLIMETSKKISTIVHASNILKCLSQDIGNLTHISKELGLHKATVHRTLKTLESEEFVVQDPTNRRYYLGPLIQRLTANPMIGHHRLILHSREELEYLRKITGETTGLQIQMGYKRVILEEVQSRHAVKIYRGKGYAMPLYTAATGKILLAELSESDLNNLLNHIRLEPVAPRTITNKEELRKEVKKVKKLGYATSLDENIVGVASIAVPIKKYFCPVALGIVGPIHRFAYMDFLEELKKCAFNISEKLRETTKTG